MLSNIPCLFVTAFTLVSESSLVRACQRSCLAYFSRTCFSQPLQGAQPLVTSNVRLEARGRMYDLDVYGGVMIVRADNDDVNEIEDFRDKVIGAGTSTKPVSFICFAT